PDVRVVRRCENRARAAASRAPQGCGAPWHIGCSRGWFGRFGPQRPSPFVMRPVSRSLLLSARGSRRTAPLEAFSRTEKIIAFCRVLLALTTLGVAIVDPKQPSFRPDLAPDLAYVVLYGYVAYSFALFLLVRGESLRQESVGRYSMALDVGWISLISIFTEGGTSPFFLLHVFVISSVSVRWGFRATMLVTVVLVLLYPVAF